MLRVDARGFRGTLAHLHLLIIFFHIYYSPLQILQTYPASTWYNLISVQSPKCLLTKCSPDAIVYLRDLFSLLLNEGLRKGSLIPG